MSHVLGQALYVHRPPTRHPFYGTIVFTADGIERRWLLMDHVCSAVHPTPALRVWNNMLMRQHPRAWLPR